MLRNEPVLQAVTAHINMHGQFGDLTFTAATDAHAFESGLILVEPITSPTPSSETWDGANDRFRAVVQISLFASSLTHARLVADEIRTILAGKTGRTYIHPLTLPGHEIETVTSNNDGDFDYDARTAQWTERYTITFQ